ncbi:MAG: hypothetical protein AAB434_04440 [Planctomycetota bacterium]
MRKAERGKIGIGAIVVCAAVGYVAWQWGVPWVDQKFVNKPQVPAASSNPDGVPQAPVVPPPAPAPAPLPDPTPAATEPETTTPGETTPSNPAPVDPREAEALKLFNKARNFEANRRWETATAMYEELIEVYKGTQAAEEAKPRLKALQNR